jgi:hypothetical protein
VPYSLINSSSSVVTSGGLHGAYLGDVMGYVAFDQVRNQHHPTLDSTSDLTHSGRGLCPGGLHGAYLGDAQWALEVGEGGFLSQFLMGSVVVFVFKTPFARLGGQNPRFWLQVPNSLVKSP